jgi:hypothetical protein
LLVSSEKKRVAENIFRAYIAAYAACLKKAKLAFSSRHDRMVILKIVNFAKWLTLVIHYRGVDDCCKTIKQQISYLRIQALGGSKDPLYFFGKFSPEGKAALQFTFLSRALPLGGP